MTLYDRVAATPGGARRLAAARLRHETLHLLWDAQAASGMSVEQLAAELGVRRRAARRVFEGNGDITSGTLARFLHAMGHEAEIRIVAAGEPRRKMVEGRGSEDWCDEPPPEVQAGLTRLLTGPDVFADAPSTRWFWWHADQLTHRWRPLFWGSDEHCNRTIGVRLPGGVLFLCLNVPLRQEECEECRAVQS